VSTGIQQQQQQQQQQQKDLALKFLLSFAPHLKSKEHWDPAKTTTTTTKGLLSFFLSFVCTSFLEIKRALGSSNKLKGLLSFLLSFFFTFSESKEQWDSTTTTTTTGLPYFFLSFFLSCFFAFATTSENEKGIGICNSNNKSTDHQQLVS
jgi:hypothetical protein